ncbi:MAG: sigma-70 family RNA polymerase sigma factor [Sporomusaceae bacterium]|nr:sigma-70 family RNA polymerase sigma factor [Sporomusaceae bacterium]
MSLQDYLIELNKVELLTPAAEAQLWSRYKDGDDLAARSELIERYQPLVFKTAGRFRAGETLMLDLIQEGTVGLIEAAESYEPQRNVAFAVYALHRIRGRMLNYLAKEGKQNWAYMDGPVNEADTATLGDYLADQGPSLASQTEQSFLVSQLKHAIDRLPQKEQIAVSGMYLEEQEPKNLAQSLDVSVSHLYRLQKQGIRRIRGMMAKLMQNW